MARRYTYATCLSWGGDEPTAELEVEVSYKVTFGRPAQTYGPAENCYPAEADEVDDIRVETVDGKRSGWGHYISDAELATDIIDKLEGSDEHLRAMAQEAAETEAADRDAAEEARWEERRMENS